MWEALGKALEQHGPLVVPLLVLTILFYKMTWKVWQAAMKSKDDEIARLIEERNRYQELVFAERLSSRPHEGKAGGAT